MREITYQEVLDMVTQVVDASPDYVYEKPEFIDQDGWAHRKCAYYDAEGNPSCLVGQALHNAGIITPANFNGQLSHLNSEPIGVVHHRIPGVKFDPQAMGFLREVQRQQDDGARWSVALMLARDFDY